MPTPEGESDDHQPATAPAVAPLNIVLIGFMATGKTTIGRQLARRAGFKFVDCDLEIEKQQRMKISEIFEKHGEAYFRELEKNYLLSLKGKQKLVISTGGGVVTHDATREVLPSLGYVVWLHAKKRAIHDRVMRNDNRPLIRTANPWKTIKTLFRARKPLYKSVANIKVKTHDLDISETVQGILDSACYHFASHRQDAPTICTKPE